MGVEEELGGIWNGGRGGVRRVWNGEELGGVWNGGRGGFRWAWNEERSVYNILFAI